MASLRRRGAFWYYRFTTADGRRVERKGAADKRETEKLAAAAETEAVRVQAGLVDPKAVALKDHASRSLGEHLAAYEASVVARGSGERHAADSRRLCEVVLNLGGVDRLDRLTTVRVERALGALRARGLSRSTVNHHVRAVKAFSRWAWREGRLPDHPLVHLSTTNEQADRRRVRRALSPDESIRLIDAARNGPTIRCLTGDDRATLYMVALGTGFRAAELASLTPESFRLDADPPAVHLKAENAKNRREVHQPIARGLADHLRRWLADRPLGERVFPFRRSATSVAIRRDLKAAGVPRETVEGVIDFHALRTTYVSRLVASGTDVKTAQTLARHSTPALTIGLYARTTTESTVAAVENLPLSCPILAGQTPKLVNGRPLPSPSRFVATTPLPNTDLSRVPKVGLEPTPPCGDRILSPARLPFRHFGQASHKYEVGAASRQPPDERENERGDAASPTQKSPPLADVARGP